MREFKNKKLNIGKSKKKVKNRKQALAIALKRSWCKQEEETQMIQSLRAKMVNGKVD